MVAGSTVSSWPATDERAAPRAHLGQALGVEGDAAAVADELVGLGDGRAEALPGEVGGDGVLGGLAHEAQALQRLEHLDPQRADAHVGPVAERPGRPHDVLLLAEADGDEGVGRAEVRVLAEPEDGHELAAGVEGVEVVAVVEVAVAGRDVGDPVGDWWTGIVVPGRDGHRSFPLAMSVLRGWMGVSGGRRVGQALGAQTATRSSELTTVASNEMVLANSGSAYSAGTAATASRGTTTW